MRGVFSAGVLDVFLERQFDPFDLGIGVSAGACNLASHVAGQHGRNRRSYCDLMTRREFIDRRRFLGPGSVLNLDWLWDRLAEIEPLRVDVLLGRAIEFLVVCTSRQTGEAVYLRPGRQDVFDALKASSALPMFYRPRVEVGGVALVDGGVADPIPVAEAYRRGARRIMVLRSRPAAAVKNSGFSERVMAWLLRREPALSSAILHTAAAYQQAVAFMTAPPPDCEVIQVAPAEPLETTRVSQDRAALERDYALGRAHGEQAIRRWNASRPTGRPTRD